MIPRDWNLVTKGYAAQQSSNAPGANAPSIEEHDELMRKYG